MVPFAERFRNVFQALNTSTGKFASDHDLNRMSIYNIMNGRNRPSADLLERICELEPRISAEYLLRGEGEPLRDMKTSGAVETLKTLLELQTHINQFIDKKARVLQD